MANPRNAGRKPKSQAPQTAPSTAPIVDRQEAARHLLRLKDAQESFQGFVRLHANSHGMPAAHDQYPKWQQELMKKLDGVERGTIPRLLITVPPRAGKSTFATQLFPAYFLLREPRRFVISASYNAELATGFGRRVKGYVIDPLSKQAFPSFSMATDSQSALHWNTTVGGQYVAVGYFGGATGRGANLLIIDDPIKNRQEADSVVMRNKVWDEYTHTFQRRVETGRDGQLGAIIIILTRWHPDDLAGRLMRSTFWTAERWQHFNVQGIVAPSTDITISRVHLDKSHPEYRDNDWCIKHSSQRYIPLPPEMREKDERSFWPERDEFSLENLRLLRKEDPRAFASLYQQTPYVQGGNMVKDEWWQFYKPDPDSKAPGKIPTEVQALIVSWDTAFSAKETADYSVGLVAALGKDGNIYVVNVIRKRVDFPALKATAISTNATYRGRGLVGHYIEDRASGQSLIQELRKESGIAVIPIRPITDKVTRLQAVLGILQGGRVYLPEEASWLDDFLNEFRTFPNGDHDDQVDAFTQAMDVLSKYTLHTNDLFTGPLENIARQPGFSQLSSSTFRGWGE